MNTVLSTIITTARLIAGRWFIAIMLLLGSLLALAQNDKQVWVQRFGPAYTWWKYPNVAVDLSGNIIVTGAGGMGQAGYVTIKYSPSGVPLWTNYYAGGYGDGATALAVASNGNIFVTGFCYPRDGEDVSPQYLTVAYTGEGVPLWTNRHIQAARPEGIVADGNADVILTGVKESVFGDGGWVTIKYSGAGVPLWTNVHYGESRPRGYTEDIAVDSNNDVIVVGSLSRWDIPASRRFFDFAAIKYSISGTALWTNRYNRGGDAYAKAVAISTNGDLFVTGVASITNYFDSAHYDIVTIKYSAAGVPLWTNLYGAEVFNYSARNMALESSFNVALDVSGNVVVAGASSSSTNDYGDFVTIKYSSDGAALWTNRYAGPTNWQDIPHAVAADANGNVFVTGRSRPWIADAEGDSVTIAYSSGGVPLWTNRYFGNLYYGATDIAVLGIGEVVVVAYSVGEYATIKYDSGFAPNTPRLSLNNAGNGNQLILSWPTNAIGFTLQSATNLTPPIVWIDVINPPVVLGGQYTVTNSRSGSAQFYRLRNPQSGDAN